MTTKTKAVTEAEQLLQSIQAAKQVVTAYEHEQEAARIAQIEAEAAISRQREFEYQAERAAALDNIHELLHKVLPIVAIGQLARKLAGYESHNHMEFNRDLQFSNHPLSFLWFNKGKQGMDSIQTSIPAPMLTKFSTFAANVNENTLHELMNYLEEEFVSLAEDITDLVIEYDFRLIMPKNTQHHALAIKTLADYAKSIIAYN